MVFCRTPEGMTNEAHLTQPRDQGKFSYRQQTEGTAVLDVPLTRDQALDLSTLAEGEPRTIAADVHGLDGIDTVTLTNKGPLRTEEGEPDTNLLEITYSLPAEANIAELYDFDEWTSTDARYAAEAAVKELTGLAPSRVRAPASDIPDTTVNLDRDGNLTFTTPETFRPGTAIDPDDFESWASEYTGFADPSVRSRLGTLIADHYGA